MKRQATSKPKLTTTLKLCVTCHEPIDPAIRKTNNQVTHPGTCRERYTQKTDSARQAANRHRREWKKTGIYIYKTLGIKPWFMKRHDTIHDKDGNPIMESYVDWDPNFYPNPDILRFIRVGIKVRRREIQKAAQIEANRRKKEAKLEEMRQSLLRMKADMDLKGSTRQPTPTTIREPTPTTIREPTTRKIKQPNGTYKTVLHYPEPEFDYDTQEEADEHLAWRDGILKDKPNVVFGNDVLDGRRPPKIRFPDRK